MIIMIILLIIIHNNNIIKTRIRKIEKDKNEYLEEEQKEEKR